MKDWPWYYFVAIAVIAFVFFFLLYYRPTSTELNDTREERIKVEKEVQQLRIQKERKERLEAEIKEITATLKDLETIIPKRREVSDILNGVQQMAYDSNLDVKEYRPEGEKRQEFYSDWPIAIEIDGNYHNLAQFFAGLGNFPRLFTIEEFNIRNLPNQGDSTTITATCKAQTYIQREQVPAKKKPVKAKKKPSRKKPKKGKSQ